jgi:ABC-type transport system involved in cytochrome bd biosynthesis fused ATPase/permease subunit
VPSLSPFVLTRLPATASVDAQSDRLIQQALQTHFKDTTILCIAHRIATLTWMDRILVMDNGEIIESGIPRNLLLQDGKTGGKESSFRKLMATHGDKFLKEAIASASLK